MSLLFIIFEQLAVMFLPNLNLNCRVLFIHFLITQFNFELTHFFQIFISEIIHIIYFYFLIGITNSKFVFQIHF
jgi:hypothetical protein